MLFPLPYSCILLFLFIFVLADQDSEPETDTCWRSTVCTGPKHPAFPGPWQTDIFAPPRRTLRPKAILALPGARATSQFPAPASLQGNGSSLVFDFGIEVGGIVSINYTASSQASLGLAFSESRNWIGEWSDSSNGKFQGPDGAVYTHIQNPGRGRYVMPDQYLRGGFRYLTLFLKTEKNATIDIHDIKVEISFQPTWPHLQAYQGYFHSSDELLNRIWYAGAYTLQTNSVPVNTGRQVPMLKESWANNATMGPGSTILVDGAKRDRAVWPGDMGIAVPSTFVSTGDLESIKNALQVIFDYQNKDGSLPEAGPPLLQQKSDTYHMWTLIGTYNYVLYSNDLPFLEYNWSKYYKALEFVYGKVDNSMGILNVTGTRDWARWQQGGFNSEANMILYQTLTTASALTKWLPNNTKARAVTSSLTNRAQKLKSAINLHLFDAVHGAYRNNVTTTTLYPQDANSLALLFSIAPDNRTHEISDHLQEDWTDIGPASPELHGNISPFITSFELQGHLAIGRTNRALELIRKTWGWYITHPNGTGSTLIEGYRTDGTFGYRSERGYGNDASYVSHSHGWSSGPTSALTNYIAGLKLVDRGGSKWSIAPQLGDLQFAEAGFMTNQGRFRVAWQRTDGGPTNTSSTAHDFAGYDLQIETPLNTEGEVILPFPEDGMPPSVILNEISGVEPDVTFRRDGNTLRANLGGGVKNLVVRHILDDIPEGPPKQRGNFKFGMYG